MVVVDILERFTLSIIDFLPKLVAAFILLLIGWIVGSIIGRVIRELLKRAKVDEYLGKERKPIFRISSIFGVIFSWAIYLAFIRAAIETLQVPALSEIVSAILAFIPGLIKAIIVVIAGYAIGEYVRVQIESSKITYSELISRVLFFLIIYVAVAMALPLVGIDPFIVNALLLVIIASIGAGMAIAIGLGLKDIVAQAAKSYLRKKRR